MDNLSRLSKAANTFLQEINDQLPGDGRLLFETVLKQLGRPSPAEYALQAVVNNLSSDELQDMLEDRINAGELEQEHLDSLHQEYPSICTDEMYMCLLQHFED